MKATAACSSIAIAVGALSILLISAVTAAPVDPDEDEQSENSLMGGADEGYGGHGWEGLDTAALRRLLLQLDADERLNRVSRSWGVPRAVYARTDGRTRSWRADKRQARFRQCYFNPISCFRK